MKFVSCGQGDRRSIVNDKGHIGACNLSLYARLGSEMLGTVDSSLRVYYPSTYFQTRFSVQDH
jgi:hypothetical protein